MGGVNMTLCVHKLKYNSPALVLLARGEIPAAETTSLWQSASTSFS